MFSTQDSAYSSHSSQSSDNHSANSASNSAFSVISSVPSPAVNRPPLSTQSSPSKVSLGLLPLPTNCHCHAIRRGVAQWA